MNLQELEARLQSLIEVDLLNILPGRKVEDVIVQKLAAAIQLNTKTTGRWLNCRAECVHFGNAS